MISQVDLYFYSKHKLILQLLIIMCWKNLLNHCIGVYENLRFKDNKNIHYEYVHELTTKLCSSLEKLHQINDERDKLSRQKLRQLQALDDKFFLNIHSSSGSILMVVRKNTEEIVNVNGTFYRILGYSEEEVIGQISSNIWVNHQDIVTIANILQNTKIIKQQIFQLRTKSGDIKNVLLSAEEIDVDGENLIFYMASDITDITKKSCCMSYRCLNDQDWTMKYMSHDCIKLTGYKIEDVVDNRKLSYGDIIYQEDSNFVWDKVQEALKEEKSYEIRYRIQTKSGKIKWIWERGQGIFSSNGELLALEGLTEDISELQKSENRLYKIRNNLRKKNQQIIKELQATNSGLKLARNIPVLLDALNVETITDIAALAKIVTSDNIANNIEPELHLVIIALGKVAVTIQFYQTITESAMQDKTLFAAKQELEAVTQHVNNLPASLQVLISQIIMRWELILNDVKSPTSQSE